MPSWFHRLFSGTKAQDGPNPEPLPDHEAFLRTLEEAGFLAHAGHDAERIRSEIRLQGWPGIFAHRGRCFPTDAEDLGKSGVGRFLDVVRPFLQAQGVELGAVRDEASEMSYAITVADRRWPICDATELEGDEGLLWILAPLRAFSLVNTLLAERGTAERLYAVNGGNDLHGFFLTPDMLAAIRDYAGFDRSLPYEIKDDPPWYGAPHREPA